jgi:HD-GYP domain-containing protein (c-di-GMP phosphodiesterase class II)
MTKISINHLKPGMVLADNIGSLRSGAILVSKGTVLNKKIIKKIYNQGIKYVVVYDVDSDSKEVLENNFVIRYEILSDKLENVFKNIKLGKKIILTEISEELDDLIVEIIQNNNILGRMRQLEEKDDYTFNHSLNVAMLATMVGKWLNYSDKHIKQLALTGLFHDIGKLKIPNNIVNKLGELTESEFEIMKKHPIYSYNILSETVGISKNVLIGVLQHHEREDGSGYPQGISGDKIHEYAKVIAICDVYDALTSDRKYKNKSSPFYAAEILEGQSFGVLNPKITRVFLDKVASFYVGCKVLLSNDEEGEVIYIHPQSPTKTIVKTGDKYINFLEPQDVFIIDIIK